MAHKIKQLLEDKDRLPAWLARTTDISENTIYDIVRKPGKDIDVLRYGTLRRIAGALGVTIEELRD